MFGKKRRREPAISTLVGKDTRVNGDIEFSGGCLVDGYVKGNVRSVGDEHSTLSISERGCIEGAVDVPNVQLNGTVKGDVRASERVVLGGKAKVVGNLQYRLIEMAIGAEVNGKLIHESEKSAEAAQSEPRKESRMAGPAGFQPVAKVNMIGD
jgi:cytoskeletal protein CcmA (bactofilin family)